MVMYGYNSAGEWDDPFPVSVNYQARVLQVTWQAWHAWIRRRTLRELLAP